MQTRKTILGLIALSMSALFVGGLAQLVVTRFQAGDIYPPYSSLRADPLGTKILYEAMGELPGMEVRRNYQPLKKFDAGPSATLLCLGTTPQYDWPDEQTHGDDANVYDDSIRALEPFVAGGGRLVIVFRTGAQYISSTTRSSSEKADVELAFFNEHEGGHGTPAEAMVAKPSRADLGEEIPWHSRIYFDKLGPQWQALYLFRGKPVIIERQYQKGSIVLCSDSFFMSNESMLQCRPVVLLARLVQSTVAVFDETHLGVHQESGIATLARSYRLEGVFFVLLGLMGLLVWRNAISFIPRGEEPDDEKSGASEGKASAAGLLGLLRKTIAPRELLNVCFQEWQHGADRNDKRSAEAAARIRSIIEREQSTPKKQQDPVHAYRAICKALTERKTHGT